MCEGTVLGGAEAFTGSALEHGGAAWEGTGCAGRHGAAAGGVESSELLCGGRGGVLHTVSIREGYGVVKRGAYEK